MKTASAISIKRRTVERNLISALHECMNEQERLEKCVEIIIYCDGRGLSELRSWINKDESYSGQVILDMISILEMRHEGYILGGVSKI